MLFIKRDLHQKPMYWFRKEDLIWWHYNFGLLGGGVGAKSKNYVWIIFDFFEDNAFQLWFHSGCRKKFIWRFLAFSTSVISLCIFHIHRTKSPLRIKCCAELQGPQFRPFGSIPTTSQLTRHKVFISCHFSHFHDCQQFKTPIGSFPSGPHHLSIFFKCSLSLSSVTCHRLWHIPNVFFFSCPLSSPAPLLFIFTQTLIKSTTSAVSKDWMCLQLTFSNHNRLYFHRLEKDVTSHDWGCSSKSFSRGMFAQKYQRSGGDGCYST